MHTFIQEKFSSFFGRQPKHVFSAPGRVNLIGEHTDYNEGFVLPMAINFHIYIAAEKRFDGLIRAIALDEIDEQGTPTEVIFALNETPQQDLRYPWSNYLRGMISELHNSGFTLTGANLVISGNVPRGAGLSSSAAFENAISLCLTQLAEENIHGIEAAHIGQAAENNFVGCRCGIMDQMVSAIGKQDHALLLDCRYIEIKHIPIPKNVSIIIVNSNIKRGLVEGEYNTRRSQCEEAARFFGLRVLRDLKLDTLKRKKHHLSSTLYKRALHVVTENWRTSEAALALSQNKIERLSELMYQSHESMKDNFDITVPAIDLLVDLIRGVIGNRGGVRMTGGGFGGCVVALIPHELKQNVIKQVIENYSSLTDLTPDIFEVKSSNGAFIKENNDITDTKNTVLKKMVLS